MDFIERLFGISPDHGSGLSEAILLIAVAAVLSALAILRRFPKRTP